MMKSHGAFRLGLVVLSALVMFFATSSFAQQMQQGEQGEGRIGDQPGAGGFIERFDANKDGKVAKDEFPRADMFDQLDANEDGFIDEDEAPTGPPGGGRGRPQTQGGEQGQGRVGDQPGAGGFMGMFDKDKDGKVTKEEFTGPENMFDQLDANGDGAITEDEAPTGPPGE